MTTYLINEDRLVELATSELRCNILDMDPEHEHFETNTKYWQDMLDAGRASILAYYYHGQGVIPMADPDSNLAKRVLPDINKRMKRLEGNFSDSSYDFLKAVFNMDDQDCYSVFGIGNRSLEDLESLNSTLINGLLDDSDLGIVRDECGFWNIETVHDEFERMLDVDDVLAIIKKKAEASTFYAENKDEVEASGFLDPNGMSRKYFHIGQEFKEFFQSFMRKEDRDAIEAADQKMRDDLQGRVEARKAEKEITND